MIIILSHQYLDFDALASMVAAQKVYPDALLIIEGKYGSFVQDFLALAKEHLPYYKLKDIRLAEVEKVILVDTHELGRCCSNKEIIEQLKAIPIEVIDHHPYNGSNQNIVIDPVGACTTLLVEKIMAKKQRLSSFEATLMALGIYDDTGSLLFENTTPRDIRAAAYLLEQGAQLGVMAEYLSRPLTMEQMEMFQQLLDHGKTEKFQEMPIYISYAESETYFSGLALLAQRIGDIEIADVCFIVVKMEDRVYVVGRSKGNGLPVNKIIEVFGGAGHEKAASAVVKDKEIVDVIKTLKEELYNRVEKPYQVRDIMSFPVKTVHPETTMEDVGNMLLRYGHTGVPVVQEGKLVGVISRRDVDKALKHGLQHAPVKGFMTKEVISVQPDLGWEEVQKLMVTHDIGRLPVVDNGKLAGIVSRSDVLQLVYGSVVPTTSQLASERSAARREDMLDLLRQLPSELQFFLDVISKLASETEDKVYLVGGFVRDLLLRVPTKDLDIVIEGDGLKFAERLSKKLDSAKLVLHTPFRTASVILSDGTHLDIAGTRREDYDFPGALPMVEASTIKEDLYRRDFTINAMALSLDEECFGNVIDYYGGFRDLLQGEIRFLHNLSFIDDPTRILRAVRFAARYRFALAKTTKDAIDVALEENVLSQISSERFSEELMLIFHEQKYQEMGKRLAEYGVLKAWFGIEYPWNFSENQDEAKRWPLEKRWLLALKNMDDESVRGLLDRLKLNKTLQKITLEYLRLREALKSKDLDLRSIDELLSEIPAVLVNVLSCHSEYSLVINQYSKALEQMKMQSDGSKLLKLGIKEGPEIGNILKEIRNQWLEGKIKTAVEEEEYLKLFLSRSHEK